MTRPLGSGAPLRGGPRRPPRAARILAVTTAALVAAAIAACASRADGDPPSDYLLEQNVYFPYQAPSRNVSAALVSAADRVYARGGRIKVALIYDRTDLGSVSALFGDPAEYARFLGIELQLWYAGPLLVVMPAGFGIYDGGRSVAAGEPVLQRVKLVASSPDDLAETATTALARLSAAGALHSPDVTAPLATAYPASARRGRPAALRLDLFDDSGRTGAIVSVYEARSLLATLASPQRFKIGTRRAELRWPVPARLHGRRLRFCVVAVDPSGNRSTPACAPFLRIQ